MWILFVLVSLVVAVVWTFRVGEGSLDRAVSNPDLRAVLVWLLAHLDLGWIFLATVNVYFSLTMTAGLANARTWAVLTIIPVMVLAWVSVATGFPLGLFRIGATVDGSFLTMSGSFPFGPIRYGAGLGPKLGSVPVALPLLWFCILIGARETVLRFRPRWGQWPLSAAVGLIAALTDLNLELPAAKLRGFWFWSEASPSLPPVFDPPLWVSLVWGFFGGAICLMLRELNVVSSARKRPWQPMVTLAIFEVVFLAARIGYGLNLLATRVGNSLSH